MNSDSRWGLFRRIPSRPDSSAWDSGIRDKVNRLPTRVGELVLTLHLQQLKSVWVEAPEGLEPLVYSLEVHVGSIVVCGRVRAW